MTASNDAITVSAESNAPAVEIILVISICVELGSPPRVTAPIVEPLKCAGSCSCTMDS
uniref:Uncharacterized protein n=1 Tax=Rhizophora mucronata TaxID=61149 RepID=A0A2P2PT85_RHIMU